MGRLTAPIFLAYACSLSGCGANPDSAERKSPGGTGGSTGGSTAQNSGGTSSGGTATNSAGATNGGSGGTSAGGTNAGSGAGGNAGTGTGGTISNEGGAANGTPGVWENVTPDDITLDPSATNDNWGLQDILVDPARPSDLYAAVAHQGIWKSTHFGFTWTKVNTGTNGSVIDTGKPYSSAIDTDATRDPATPPTLFTTNGNAQLGFWKSTDGAVSWARTELPGNNDIYSFAVDPYDGQHLITGFHEQPGVTESTDGGATWTDVDAGDSGISVFPFFIDTGDAATTRTTWLTVAQRWSGGTWRTTNGGADWTSVESLGHPHGGCQIVQDGSGVVLVAGGDGSEGDGVYRSTDFGATWARVSDHGGTTMVATPSTLYSFGGWPNPGGADPNMQTAPRDAATPWASVTAPEGMINGPKSSAVTHQGSQYIIVGANWQAGIWRYVEPE